MRDENPQGLSNEDRLLGSLRTAWRHGVPTEASVLHARWWQLETWLRELVYVELKAKYGVTWGRQLQSVARGRAAKEAAEADYMLTADSHHVLAYLDVGRLFKLIDNDEWPILSHSFPPLDIWRGRADELQTIRNRISHCRRPHMDDLGRVEQTLRDLETGAFRSVAAFNRKTAPDSRLEDPMVAAWIRREHLGAQRLIDHCDTQYDVRLRVTYSVRPWAEATGTQGSPVTGRPGYLWHAHWTIGRGYFEARRFWSEWLTDDVKDLLVFVSAPSRAEVSISFAAVDDPSSVVDAIEHVFDGIIHHRGRRVSPDEDTLDGWDQWVQTNRGLDPRVVIDSPWSIVNAYTTPVTLFGA